MVFSRKPVWLKTRIPSGAKFQDVRRVLHDRRLHTVCVEADCPNRGECWGKFKTATFMVLGRVCTRNCRFCAVESSVRGEPLDTSEPARVAEAARDLGLDYVVLTSVDRDDLPDYGASHFAECVREVKEKNPGVKVEVLIPDFQGRLDCLRKVVEASPDVVAHNIETVRRLQKKVRDARAGYMRSLEVLANVKKINPKLKTKSSILLGFGETRSEVLEAFRDLRNAGVDFLVLGQYLQPTGRQIPVAEYVTPEAFESYREAALDMGFVNVVSKPLARTSYRAKQAVGV